MPALTPVVDSLDKVPEAARPYYEQKDGKFHVILDAAPAGFTPAADLAAANGKVVEFRDKNISLLQEVEVLRPLKTAFEGIDPAKARDALTRVGALELKGVKGVDDVAAMIQTGIQAAMKPVTEQLEASQKLVTAERERANKQTLRSTIAEKFLKAGGKAGAVDYIVGKAAEVFAAEGDAVKAQANKFSSTKPGEPLGIEEWLTTAAKEHDFAFEPSKGGGADPNKGGGGALKPGQTILLDPTPKQLGENSKAIADGKVKVQYTNA